MVHVSKASQGHYINSLDAGGGVERYCSLDG